MTEKVLVKEFKRAIEDDRWIARSFSRLAKRFDGQFIAVYKKKVIDHDADARKLGQRLRENHPDLARFASVEYVSTQKVDLVL